MSFFFKSKKNEQAKEFIEKVLEEIESSNLLGAITLLENNDTLAPNGIKIEIYPNDHVPPHFHISANGNNASLAIDDCRVLKNSGFDPKVIKNIQDWFLNSKDRLIEVWNETRASDCMVGKI